VDSSKTARDVVTPWWKYAHHHLCRCNFTSSIRVCQCHCLYECSCQCQCDMLLLAPASSYFHYTTPALLSVCVQHTVRGAAFAKAVTRAEGPADDQSARGLRLAALSHAQVAATVRSPLVLSAFKHPYLSTDMNRIQLPHIVRSLLKWRVCF
jgi:hypothetical protein